MKKRLSYREKARAMRHLGVSFGFPLNRKLNPAAKGWVTRRWRDYAGYVAEKNRFRLVPANKAQRRELRKTIPKQQLTGRGVLVQVPKGGRAWVSKAGRLIVTKGRLREETYSLNRVRFARDPRAELTRLYHAAKGGHKKLFVTFKGYQGGHKYNLFQFLYYLENELLPELEDEERSESEIGRYFGVKIVTITPKRKGR
jgi:hypothetical protein